jgi:hypothetical protein
MTKDSEQSESCSNFRTEEQNNEKQVSPRYLRRNRKKKQPHVIDFENISQNAFVCSRVKTFLLKPISVQLLIKGSSIASDSNSKWKNLIAC